MLKYLDPHDKESGKDRFKNKKAHFKANGGPSTSETPISDAGDEAATQESDDPDEEYLEKLHERVRRVIRGHLQWISTQTECWKDGTFAPHYWPTGRRIDDLDYLSSPSLIDTPLQLLKVYHILDLEPREKNQQPMTMREYFAKENKDKEQDWLVAELQPKVRSWIEEMHAGNERGTYTFSRKPKRNQDYDSDDDENREPKYCLTDHVMIGMALKCVEKLKMPTEDENDVTRQQAQETISRSNNAKKPWCYYIYDEVRSKTLKRFTVVNTVANQRMFATSRRSDDTRFLLHSKDTYLFFAANMEYFKGPKAPSSREPKDAKSSKLADAWRRADDRWTKLLDAQSNYDEFRHSEWKKPLWYAIAFVLGNMGKPVTGEWSEKEAKTPNLILLEPSWYNGLFPGRLGKQGKPALHERESGRDEYWFSTFELPNVLWTFRLGEATMGSGKPVEKHTNFVNLSHPKDKIEPKIVLDDWLQRPPAILDFTSEPDSVPPQAEDADTDKRVDKIFDGFNNELPQSRLGVIIDVPRYSLGYELSKNQIDKSACFALKTQRTVWESKKRIIWLSVRNSDVAKKVYEATRGIEKETVLSFLRRNSNFDTYFHDSATAALNLWETELHLSFFRPSELEGEVLDCMEGTRLAFTTMSLRFSGDFSDRYWTCYFLEHGTHDRKKETAGAHATQDGKQKASGEHATQDSNTATLGLRLVPREEDCIIGGNLDLKLSGQDLVQALKELRNPDQNLAQALEELGCSVQGLLQAFNELECSAQDIVQALEELGRGSGQDVIQAFEQLGCTVRDLVQTLKELGYPARDVVQSLKELGYPAQDIRQAFEDLEYPLQDIRLPRERLRDSVEDNGPALQGLESRGLEPGVRRKLRASAKRMKKDSMFLRAWQQRRVLELLMFSKMLQELHESTTQVLQLIKRLALQSDKLQNLDSKYQLFATAVEEAKQLQKVGVEDDYDSISAKWREYGQILVVVEENLTDNIERIKQWDRREKDRQNEQPRWTDQDKRNHAATILRLRILCERQAIEIDRLKNDVMAFRDSLPNRLETIRNDIAFRDSQNINLFTYVTVVFLPLGFAAGILSMNGAPDHHLLMNLVTLALGALGITLFALLNAQIVKTMVSPLIDGYWALTHTLFLWQFAKYTFFHVITRRAIEKRAGKTSTHRQSDNKQESPAPISASTRKNDLRRRWQQKYDEIRKFRYREARLKLEKSLDSKDTDEITTVPQEPSPPQPDIKDSSHRSGEEMV
jgi:Mg2+ and Co2+ transporter CorA